MENSNNEIIQLAKEALKQEEKEAKKRKQDEDSEITKANASKPRVTVRTLDSATEMLIKPRPIIDHVKEGPIKNGGWVVTLALVVGGSGFVSNFEAELVVGGVELAWLDRLFIVIAVLILIWIFFIRYSMIRETLGLRITDKDEEGKRYYILFRKDSAKPLRTGRLYKGGEANLEINLFESLNNLSIRARPRKVIYNNFGLNPVDQIKIQPFIDKIQSFLFEEIGVRTELIPIIKKSGYLTIASLKGVNARKLHNDVCSMRKKINLNDVQKPTIEEVELWL